MNYESLSESTLSKISNKIGHFTILLSENEFDCIGVVRKEKEVVVLECELPVDIAKTIYYSEHPFRIIGHVSDIPVTLYKPYVKGYETSGMKPQKALLIVSSIYIVVGYAEKKEICVYNINMSNSDINWFFLNHPINLHPLEGNTVIEKLDSLSTSDSIGSINIHQSISEGMTNKSAYIDTFTVLSCSFEDGVDIESAVHRMASLRNLLAFFFDGYIPLENMRISDKKEQKTAEDFIEYDLINTHPEKQSPQDRLFYINADIIRNGFDQVWKKWFELYESARPMTALFYGVISGTSSGLNEFLNMSQALEVYSDRYRTATIRKNLNKSKKDKIHLSERLKDLIDLYNAHLGIIDTEKFANNLADIRNYYTHYNKRFKHEPEYEVVVSGSYILRSILLLVVYSEIGIPSDKVSDAKRIGFLRDFDDYSKVVMGYDKSKLC